MTPLTPKVQDLIKQGLSAKVKGDFSAAKIHLQSARIEAQKTKDRWGEARVLLELAPVVTEFDKDLATGRKLLKDCLKIYTKLKSDQGRAYAMSNLGSLDMDEGNLDAALKWQTEALGLFEKVQDKYGCGMALHQTGNIESAQGNFLSAEKHWRESLLLFEGLHRNYAAGQALLSLGKLRVEHYKDAQQAKLLFSRALTLFEEEGLTHEAEKARHNLALFEREEGETDDWQI